MVTERLELALAGGGEISGEIGGDGRDAKVAAGAADAAAVRREAAQKTAGDGALAAPGRKWCGRELGTGTAGRWRCGGGGAGDSSAKRCDS